MDPSSSSTRTTLHAAPRRAAITDLFALVSSTFGWLMCTLAAGAVAAFASLVLGVRPCWMILAVALPLTGLLRLCGCVAGRWGAPVAALAVLVAAFYAACLVAIARIAAVTGFSFALAFRTGGTGLTFQVARLGLDPASVLVYAAAAVVAALFAGWLVRSPAART